LQQQRPRLQWAAHALRLPALGKTACSLPHAGPFSLPLAALNLLTRPLVSGPASLDFPLAPVADLEQSEQLIAGKFRNSAPEHPTPFSRSPWNSEDPKTYVMIPNMTMFRAT